MTEIAAVLAAALSDLGYETTFPAPGLPERGRDRVNIVVAPHEFFPLKRRRAESELLAAAEASVVVGVEQPGTSWFEIGTRYASVAAAVLDISPYAVEELRSRGLQATHLQLGYHPSLDRWGGDPASPRDTDLLFLGSLTPRRDKILSEASPLLWDCKADIRLFEFPRPMSKPRGNFVVSEEKWDLLASSRVMLNIHRDEVPYFEWVRVLEAVINGCLVVSERSSDYGPLVPGKHLVAVPPETLGAYALGIMSDEPLRAEMASEAYEFARSKLELTSLLEPICAEMEVAAARRGPRGRVYRPPDPEPPREPARPAGRPRQRTSCPRAGKGTARQRDRARPARRGARGAPSLRRRRSRRGVEVECLGGCLPAGERHRHLLQLRRLHHRDPRVRGELRRGDPGADRRGRPLPRRVRRRHHLVHGRSGLVPDDLCRQGLQRRRLARRAIAAFCTREATTSSSSTPTISFIRRRSGSSTPPSSASLTPPFPTASSPNSARQVCSATCPGTSSGSATATTSTRCR